MSIIEAYDRKMHHGFYKAFSMAEILLVIGIFVVVAAIALPIGLGNLTRENQDNIAKQLESDIFSQQQKAYSGKGSGEFGVRFGLDSYWLFEGASFSQAVTSEEVSFDRDIQISEVNIADATNEILFVSGELAPVSSGAIKIQDSNRSYILSINGEGSIDINIVINE